MAELKEPRQKLKVKSKWISGENVEIN